MPPSSRSEEPRDGHVDRAGAMAVPRSVRGRARRARLRSSARVEPLERWLRADERPAVQLDDALDIRRPRRLRAGRRLGDELVARRDRERGLNRRSKPIVVDAFELIAAPQSEPATWPGNTSTPSASSAAGAASGRALRRPRAPRPRGRAARRRRRRASRRSARATARRRGASITANAQCSGRWPGVWIVRIDDRADLDLVAVVERIVRELGLGARVDAIGSRARARAGRGRRRGRRACASRGRATSRTPGARPPRGTARSRRRGRRPPRRPASSSPIRYDAQPRSSSTNCWKSTGADRSNGRGYIS